MQVVDHPCETPVLLIAFRRPETTARVFEAIRRARPQRLYVAANAPRPGNVEEAERCAAVRKLVQAVDWDCSLQTLFRDEHLDAGASVSSAIGWFFGAVEEGIILEDDCLPDATFFRFCGEMLERYRNTSNVMQVAGYNFLSGSYKTESDYLFSHFGWQWGWATWKRAWDTFDLQMTGWPKFKELGFHQYFPFYPQRALAFDAACAGKLNTWDYQWHYAVASNSGLSVVPKFSLIENIGFGVNATHEMDASVGDRYRAPIRPMPFPPTHPRFLYADRPYDEMLMKSLYPLTIKIRAKILASRLLARWKSRRS
jgi:hypothetical protein